LLGYFISQAYFPAVPAAVDVGEVERLVEAFSFGHFYKINRIRISLIA
jgi:hypothetical protein